MVPRHIVLNIIVTTKTFLSMDKYQIIVLEGEDKNEGHLILPHADVTPLPLS